MAQLLQNIQHNERIFAAGDANHDAVSFANHLELLNGTPNLAAKSLAEFLFVNR
jgi:hypothetical protein